MNSTSLDGLQSQVEQHFDRLASDRKAVGLPLFALEHGLDRTQVAELAEGLRQHIRYGNGLRSVWLLWVVYATEMGYDFDGEEFWQSFERRTPQWRQDNNRRNLLRSFFERFEKRFGGAVPFGPWARQFSIIAWPITHAVLPKDLQSQMARTLFESRHEIAAAADRPATVLGALVARCAEWPSSRFRNFLEQEELTGHIARALLFPDDDDVEAVLTPQTQARIVGDLEASWEAKSWLREARKVANEVRIGLMFRRTAEVLKVRRPDARDAKEVAEATCVAPKVFLRRCAANGWRAFVELPSFSGWARANPRIDTFVRRTRCKVSGTEDIWRSKRWLLFGAQQCRVIEWPAAGSPWIRFDDWEEGTSREIDEACRVSSRPWLFRVDDDGSASQLKWKSVRPGATYVVVNSSQCETGQHLTSTAMEVKGGFAYLLSVPSQATDSSTRCLADLGLSVARTLKVWPAGLPPLGYGGEDLLEWSTHHPLTLGVEHDETCEGFSLHVDGKDSTFATGGRRVSFVGLGKLSPGLHQITVAATYRTADGKSQLRTQASQRSFSVVVRTPVASAGSRVDAPVLVVATDPYEPSLDTMLSGTAACTVHGPLGRAVDFHLELLSGSGETIHQEMLGTLELPVDHAAWRQLVAKRDDVEKSDEALFKANGGRLVVDAHELGKTSVALRHSLSPVRWHVARSAKRVKLTVVDDTDHTESVRAYRACFQFPSQEHASWEGLHDLDVEGDGGLYVVKVNGHRSSLVVNAQPAKMSWDAWTHSTPKLADHLSCAEDVVDLLRWLRDWSDARVVGLLAEHRRNSVVREMHRQLFATMCDMTWAALEQNFNDTSGSQSAREALESYVWLDHNPSLAIGLSKHAKSIVSSSMDETCEKFLHHVAPYSVCGDRRLCEQALRLAIVPDRFVDWAGTDASKKIDELVHLKTLVKAARILALLNGQAVHLVARDW